MVVLYYRTLETINVRERIEMGSPIVRSIGAHHIFRCYESRQFEGTTRLRVDDGWTSLHATGFPSDVLVVQDLDVVEGAKDEWFEALETLNVREGVSMLSPSSRQIFVGEAFRSHERAVSDGVVRLRVEGGWTSMTSVVNHELPLVQPTTAPVFERGVQWFRAVEPGSLFATPELVSSRVTGVLPPFALVSSVESHVNLAGVEVVRLGDRNNSSWAPLAGNNRGPVLQACTPIVGPRIEWVRAKQRITLRVAPSRSARVKRDLMPWHLVCTVERRVSDGGSVWVKTADGAWFELMDPKRARTVVTAHPPLSDENPRRETFAALEPLKVRAGDGLDSAEVRVIGPGEVFTSTQRLLNDAGVTRLRVDGGWTSYNTPQGEPLVRPENPDVDAFLAFERDWLLFRQLQIDEHVRVHGSLAGGGPPPPIFIGPAGGFILPNAPPPRPRLPPSQPQPPQPQAAQPPPSQPQPQPQAAQPPQPQLPPSQNNNNGGGDDDDDNRMDMSCVVCLVEARNMMFTPCGHFCVCQSCSAPLVKCPICRVSIKGKQKVFL